MKQDLHTKGSPRKILIYSTCRDEWGGSEVLWSEAVPLLRKQGATVFVCKQEINPDHVAFRKLSEDHGVHLIEAKPGRTARWGGRVKRLSPGGRKRAVVRTPGNPFSADFHRKLRQIRPDLVIISQAINFDGLVFALQCLKLGLPYVIVSHKAVDFYWPDHRERDYMASVWRHALKCYFVSSHNLRITEQQFGFHFFNAEIISNPLKIAPVALPYPPLHDECRLACVGRLFVLDKGQDILLRVLSLPRWRERPLSVTFIGTGVDEKGLREMAAFLHLSQVAFSGPKDPESIWKEFHALILPSRSEGMPLVITEAMAAGRPVIATNAGGNAEILEDGATGFISEITEKSLDETLERAWQARERWAAIGLEGSRRMERRVRIAPEQVFVNHINTLIYGKR